MIKNNNNKLDEFVPRHTKATLQNVDISIHIVILCSRFNRNNNIVCDNIKQQSKIVHLPHVVIFKPTYRKKTTCQVHDLISKRYGTNIVEINTNNNFI